MMGIGIMMHGYPKLFSGRMDKFAEGVAALGFPFPVAFAWAAALSEFLGGIFVAIGLKTRIAAMFIFVTMAVAAFLRHAADPFKVKELALAYLTAAAAIAIMGAGKFSLDRK